MDTGYLKELHKGYLDEQGVIKRDLILKYPKVLAKNFGEGNPKLSTKQARSFFDAFNKIYLNVIGKREALAEALIDVAMLSTKINDKFNKGTVSEDFKAFIDENVEQIKTEKDLRAFVLHFEAVCNYLKDTKVQKENKSNGGNKR